MRLHNSGTWRHSAYVPYRKWRTRNHGSRTPRPTHIPMTVIWILRIQCIIPNRGYQSMIMTLSRQSLQSVRLKLLFFLYAANLRNGTNGFTSPPKEGVLRTFRPKNPTTSDWFEPANLGTEASTLPLHHRSPLLRNNKPKKYSSLYFHIYVVSIIWDYKTLPPKILRAFPKVKMFITSSSLYFLWWCRSYFYSLDTF